MAIKSGADFMRHTGSGLPGYPEAGSGDRRPQGRFAPRKCAMASEERGHP
jgi:hypothetical protein